LEFQFGPNKVGTRTSDLASDFASLIGAAMAHEYFGGAIMTRTLQSVAHALSPSVEREAVQTIPTIDLSCFLRDSTTSVRQQTAERLRKACIDVGFFYLTGHQLPAGELDEMVVQARRFFALPTATKLRYRSTEVGGNGFVQVGGLAGQSATAADVKERFIMARATSRGDGSHWPDETTLPGFTSFMKAHIEKRTWLAKALAKAFALSLRLPEHYFDDDYRDMGCNVIINYYPPLNAEQIKANQWSFAAHTDYGSFTLLSQDSLGGLQVRNSEGMWIDVPPLDNAFVVNLGDLMARWTNDLYTSTLHRALNVANVARISIPFFVYPSNTSVIKTLPTCDNVDHPSKYPPVMAGDYMRELVVQADRTGRAGISEKTAERLKQT
jgi:isopenicillin N synthase-like dioxygenase